MCPFGGVKSSSEKEEAKPRSGIHFEKWSSFNLDSRKGRKREGGVGWVVIQLRGPTVAIVGSARVKGRRQRTATG